MSKQPLLRARRSAVTPESAIGRDHPVARNHDRQGIGGERRAHRPCRLWLSDPPRELTVGNPRAVGKLAKRLPYATLKSAACGRERKLEGTDRTTEISAKLSGSEREHPRHRPRPGRCLTEKVQAEQIFAVGPQFENPKRRFDARPAKFKHLRRKCARPRGKAPPEWPRAVRPPRDWPEAARSGSRRE